MKSLSQLLIIFILIALNIDIFAQGDITWTSGRFRLEIIDGKISVYENKEKLLTISSINFNFTPPKSYFVAFQSKKKLVLTFTYPAVARYREQLQDLTATVDITTENHTLRFFSSPEWASHCTIHLEDKGEHYFGILEPLFPNNKKSPDLRGEVVDIEVVGNASLYHENYASAWSAFYITNKGYASFFDTFARGRYKLGIDGKTELFHQTNTLDWYIFTGSNGDEIMQAYYSVIGKPKFVPMWACGPIGWRDENKGGKDEILDDIQKMTDLKIPFTAWFVDRPYSNGAQGWSQMDFNEQFANPEEWISTIRNSFGMEFMTWVSTLTFSDSNFPTYLYNTEGYFDLTNPDAINEFGRRLKKNQYAVGVRGHKMDRADQRYPLNTPWYDKTAEPKRRNKYVYLFSTTVDSILRDAWGENQVNFARAAFHRCQPYLTAVWGGDSRSSWDGMAANLANGIRCGFMGFPIWGSDVGGYLTGRIPENLYARWLQFGTWSALYEIKIDDAGGRREDRPPWKYSAQLQKIFRNCNTLRMEMQPFFYSLANTSYKNGVIMKPLAYAYPNDQKTYDLWSEYQVGNTFLVAPILDSTNTRLIYLPRGTWYDFYDVSKTYKGNSEIEARFPLEQIPVFIRANSIYVTGVKITGNSGLWITDRPANELNIHIFPGKNRETAVFDYVDYTDSNKEKQFTVTRSYAIVKFSTPSLTCNATAFVKLEKKPSSVELNNESVQYDWNAAKRIVKVSLKKNAENIIIIDE